MLRTADGVKWIFLGRVASLCSTSDLYYGLASGSGVYREPRLAIPSSLSSTVRSVLIEFDYSGG